MIEYQGKELIRMTAAEQEKKILEWRESGMTERSYCVQEGIAYETFRTWIKRRRKRYGEEVRSKSYDEYREIVYACLQSGQTAKDWCAARGINVKTYYGWRKKVNRKEGRNTVDAQCGVRHGRQPEPKISANPILCEVRR